MTMECSCRLWPSPGMYAVTSNPFVSRTRATLRNAELGFFGVVVYTRVQTPRFCGLPRSAGAFSFFATSLRPWRTSWLMVGIPLKRRPRKSCEIDLKDKGGIELRSRVGARHCRAPTPLLRFHFLRER